MSERIVTARHRQLCDMCHCPIEAGERCRLIRDDFWPAMVWFEHLRCPGDEAPAAEPCHPEPPKAVPAPAYVQ